MNNFPRVSAILARIPDAATRWPGWMWPACGICGEDCDIDANCEHFCLKHDAEILVPKFGPILDEAHHDAWHGNDTDPRNMHHLWSMLEAVEKPECCPLIGGGANYYFGVRLYNNGGYGESDNIIEAMLRCLEEAVK